MNDFEKIDGRSKGKDVAIKKIKICVKKFVVAIWKMDSQFYLVYAISVLINTITPFINMIFPKYIMDELIGHGNMRKIIIYIGCIAILNYFVNIVQHSTNALLEGYDSKFSKYVEKTINDKIMQMDYQSMEDKKTLEQLEKAKMGISSYSGGMGGILDVIKRMIISVLQLSAISFIVLERVPWLIIIFLLSIIFSNYFMKILNQLEFKLYTQLSKVNHVFNYFSWELQELRFGMDIRLFHAEEMMEDKAEKYNIQMLNEWRKEAKISLPVQLLLNISVWGCTVLELIILAVQALNGLISIGEFYELYNAGNILLDSITGIVLEFENLKKRCNYAYEYIIFMQYPNLSNKGTKRINKEVEHEVEFRNVFFHYPNSKELVLKNINLVLKQGEHISIVGLNGAGKTTLIKLLCRFYTPTEGAILLDGVNIVEYAYEDYIKLISGVFQDYQTYAFTMLENIKMSDSDGVICTKNQMDNLMLLTKKKYQKQLKKIENAVIKEPLFITGNEQRKNNCLLNDKIVDVIKQVGLYKVVEQLNYGLNTFVNKQYENEGTDFSGGEKQKIVIARALYKNAAIVIFDEPTAALDPIAENEIYCKFGELVRNKTAIYISHRLASCQFCDRIYVFHQGEIKESGTHEELLSISNGFYAKMFSMQARYYDAN